MAGFTILFLILLLWLAWPKSKGTPRQIDFDVRDLGTAESKGSVDTQASDNLTNPPGKIDIG